MKKKRYVMKLWSKPHTKFNEKKKKSKQQRVSINSKWNVCKELDQESTIIKLTP